LRIGNDERSLSRIASAGIHGKNYHTYRRIAKNTPRLTLPQTRPFGRLVTVRQHQHQTMPKFLRYFLSSLLLGSVGCANNQIISRQKEPRIIHIASFVDFDLIGNAGIRLHQSGSDSPIMGRDQLKDYFHTLFSKYDNRFSDVRYTITLQNSGDLAYPHNTCESKDTIDFIKSIAREYNCDVCIIATDTAGYGVMEAYYQTLPWKTMKHQEELSNQALQRTASGRR